MQQKRHIVNTSTVIFPSNSQSSGNCDDHHPIITAQPQGDTSSVSVTSVTAQKKSRIINRWYGVTDVHFYLCLHHISILLFLLWHKSRVAKMKQKKKRWGWTGSWGVKGFGIKNLPLLILLTRKADLRFHHNTALINTFQCRKKTKQNHRSLSAF